MFTDKLSRKTFLIANIFLALICITLCWIINSIAGNIIHDTQSLILFRQQLLLSSIGVYVLFASVYVLYLILRPRLQPLSQSCNNNASSTHVEPVETQPLVSIKKQVHSKHNTIKNINKLRILAVDDNTANLLVIQNYLAVQDIPVILASSGIEALTIIETQPVDLIFMDIEMSGMDGIQTTHSIRANETMRTPIVAISAHDESYKRLEVLAHGFDDYLAKPINPDTLTAAVQRWCQIKTTNIAAAAPKAILTAAPKTTPTPKTEPKTSPNTPSKTNHAAHIQHVTKIQTPSTTPTIKKVVDIQQSLVHSNHNNALAKDILDLLIQMVKDEKENIASYHTRNDWDSLYKLNHKIYGGSSYCGVPELQSANQQLEKLLQAKLHFGQESTKESHAEEDLIGIENTHTQTQKIDDAMAQLFSAIDDLIQWDNEYDTSIVFDVENL